MIPCWRQQDVCRYVIYVFSHIYTVLYMYLYRCAYVVYIYIRMEVPCRQQQGTRWFIVFLYVQMYIYIHIYIHIYRRTCIQVCTYICICVYVIYSRRTMSRSRVGSKVRVGTYGVASIIRLLKIIGLFCRLASLL